ncbi:MAG: uncharacterized protein PWP31_1078 [Clostridia bacterium]|nr:uncharacterized protein [Clostridia bacterium]
MWGTWVNVLAILVGSFIGSFIGKYLPRNLLETLTQATGLGIVLVGLSMSIQSSNLVLIIVSLVIGGITGELIDIEGKLVGFGQKFEQRISMNGGGKITKAFVSASLVYCVGAMAIMGPLEAGLRNSYNTLFSKAILDGILAVSMSTSLGWGVALSSIAVLMYQGSLTLLASWLQFYLTNDVIREITASGGLLIIAIGLSVLKIKDFKVGNLLPAILYAGLLSFWLHWI